MTSPPQNKYRPVLTLPELEHLCTILASAPAHDMNAPLLNKLRLLAFKGAAGITAPAYMAAPRESLEDKLGFAPSLPHNDDARNIIHGGLPDTPINRKRLALYKMWEKYPSALSSSELEQVQQYRYDAQLMFPHEIPAFLEEQATKLAALAPPVTAQ